MDISKDVSIFDVVEPDMLKNLLNSFVLATGLGAIFIDPVGQNSIVPNGYDEVCPFCKTVRSCPMGIERCKESMVKGGELASKLGEPYIFRCHAGLIEFSAPIMFEDIYLGSISCGPALMWNWDEIAINEIQEATKDLPVNKESLLVASSKIKILTSKSVQASAELLFVMASYIAKRGITELQQRKELSEQQARLAEAIFEMKRAQETIRLLESRTEGNGYPVDKERELIGKVRIGDKTSAKKILNEILGTIFFQNAGNLEIMKARLMELVVLLSRAAVEGGGSLDKLLGLNYSFISELSSINKFEDLCRWIVKVLDAFLDSVYETKNIKNAKILSEAMNYIRRNYNNDLSLEKVAQSIYISPYYLSHLFKEELNITFVEYLTMVRVEEAKKLLSDPSMSILAIASEVGYEDASYFSKVFKKTTGLSPNQYRNAC